MASAVRTSVEEYLSSHYEPECELIQGELIPKPMGTLEHMRMERRLEQILARYERSGLGEVVRELSMLKGDDVRIPDVVFAPAGAQYLNGILLDPPLLCIEILSPSQRPSELFAKCEAYHAWGVPFCWIVDPVKKLAWVYHREAPVQLVPGDGSLQAGKITVSCNELFA